jgi:hypothetical protein
LVRQLVLADTPATADFYALTSRKCRIEPRVCDNGRPIRRRHRISTLLQAESAESNPEYATMAGPPSTGVQLGLNDILHTPSAAKNLVYVYKLYF